MDRCAKVQKEDNSHMQSALYYAGRSTMRQKHGALIMFNGHSIGEGWNSQRQGSDFFGFDKWSLHAEAMAIIRAMHDLRMAKKRNLGGSVLYSARCKKSDDDGNMFAFSRPCPSCMRLISAVNIERIVYADGYGRHLSEFVE